MGALVLEEKYLVSTSEHRVLVVKRACLWYEFGIFQAHWHGMGI